MILSIQYPGDADRVPQRFMLDNVSEFTVNGLDKRSNHKHLDPNVIKVHRPLFEYTSMVVRDECNSLKCKTSDGKLHIIMYDMTVYVLNNDGKTIDRIRYYDQR